MALGEIVFVAEDCDASSYGAVRDESSAVDIHSVHDYAVLDLGAG